MRLSYLKCYGAKYLFGCTYAFFINSQQYVPCHHHSLLLIEYRLLLTILVSACINSQQYVPCHHHSLLLIKYRLLLTILVSAGINSQHYVPCHHHSVIIEDAHLSRILGLSLFFQALCQLL